LQKLTIRIEDLNYEIWGYPIEEYSVETYQVGGFELIIKYKESLQSTGKQGKMEVFYGEKNW
jgi:hypothetical protein